MARNEENSNLILYFNSLRMPLSLEKHPSLEREILNFDGLSIFEEDPELCLPFEILKLDFYKFQVIFTTFYP